MTEAVAYLVDDVVALALPQTAEQLGHRLLVLPAPRLPLLQVAVHRVLVLAL